ncbi:MAG: family 10 glycosylhydrolase [Victivallales bacterium]|nr:family 10 glycosylhydrolase [Victivallales bacterium]
MKKLLFCALFTACCILWAQPLKKQGIPAWNPLANLDMGKAACGVEDGVSFMRLTTTESTQKHFMGNRRFIEATPGSKFTLRFRAKSDIEAKGGVRAGVNFLTLDMKRAPIKNYNVMVYCHGSREWKEFECPFVMPEGADGFNVIACIYLASGTAEFTDFRLLNEKGEAIPLPNADFTWKPGERRRELDLDEEPDDAVWSYSFKVGKKGNQFFFTGLHLGAELVQFDTPNTLKYLPATGEGRSRNAMPYILRSLNGSSYWQLCNMTTLEQVFMWSDESIPLEGGLKKVSFPIPFTTNHPEYHCSLAKGAYAFRGHRYFHILDGDTYLGSAVQKAVDPQISPEAGFFGEGRSGNQQPLLAGLFTLADLTAFKVEIVEFRSSGKPGGPCAFRLELTDAAGDCFPVQRVESIFSTGVEFPFAPQFDRYAIPTGWFVGKYGEILPKKVDIYVTLRASMREGVKNVSVKGSFATVATAQPVFLPDKEPFCIKPGEGRGVCLPPQLIPTEEEKGLAAVKKIVAQMQKAHLTELMPFGIGNRCNGYADLGNPYMSSTHQWDLFQVLREETRKAGIRLTGVVCLLPEGAEKPMGFLAAHPDYAMLNAKKQPSGWLDPAVPEVRAYRVRDIVTLAKKYQLDGIQLDYARLTTYPSTRGAELYKAQFGVDPREFEAGSEEYVRWYAWESENLTQLIREIRAALKKECPDVILSAYVQGYRYNGERLWNEGHQPFGKWLQEGLMDMIAPTGYVYDMLLYRCWVKRQIDYCHAHNPKVPVWITIGARSSHGAIEDLKELVDQIDYANRLGADGAEFFQWAGLEPFLDGLSKTRYAAP